MKVSIQKVWATNRVPLAICLSCFSLQLSAQVSFTLATSPSVGNEPISLSTADLNADGKPDLVSANFGSSTLSVLTNVGIGTFMPLGTYSVGNKPWSVVCEDVNGDGFPDLISANSSSATLSVLTNNAGIGFALATSVSVGSDPRSVTAADINGDGLKDLIAANFGNGTVSVLTNNGDGRFVLCSTPAVNGSPFNITTADANGDGKLDILTANYGGDSLTVLTNDGVGAFSVGGLYPVGVHPRGVAFVDVNGDGKGDLASCDYDSQQISVFTNDGSGGFVSFGKFPVSGSPNLLIISDVNGDGKPDMITPNYQNSLSVLMGNQYSLAASPSVGANPNAVVAADVDADGRVDLISANDGDATLSVLTNTTPFPALSIPRIIVQPTGKTNIVGANLALTVVATSDSGPLLFDYRWRLAGTNLPNATNNVLALRNAEPSQTGIYDVVIENSAGSITSSPVFLDVRFVMIRVNGQPAAATMEAVGSAVVSISGGYPNGYTFYTLNGSAPNGGSTLYSGPISLTNSAVVRALSLSSDFSQSYEAAPVTVLVKPTYNLDVTESGNGTVTVDPRGTSFPTNSLVTLTAHAATNWAFDHWEGDVSGSENPLSLTIDGPRTVKAVFVQTAYPITVSTPGGGGVNVNGQTIPPATYYPTGTVISIAATSAPGWSFVQWQGTVSTTNNPLLLTVNQTNNLQAVFGTMVSTNSLGGSVILSPPNPVPFGATLTVSAVPNPGNCFAAWGGSISGTNTPAKITVTQPNPSVSALFSALPEGKYSLTTIVNGNGAVTILPYRNYYNSNTVLTVRATPNSGSYFFGWSQDGSGTNTTLTVVMNSNKTLVASFGVAPVVTISPMNVTVLAGNNTALTANAVGLPPLSYQWLNNSHAIPGATNFLFLILNAQPTNAGSYSVVVSNSFGAVTSSVANVTVIAAPTIESQPQSQTVKIGHSASFIVQASGWPALNYQWKLDGADVFGATNASLTLSNAFPASAGLYSVAITNVYGSVTSTPALLSVLPLTILTPTPPIAGPYRLCFDTATGVNYRVDYSDDLIDWFPFISIDGNGSPLTLIDPSSSSHEKRFYRIFLAPK